MWDKPRPMCIMHRAGQLISITKTKELKEKVKRNIFPKEIEGKRDYILGRNRSPRWCKIKGLTHTRRAKYLSIHIHLTIHNSVHRVLCK